MLLLFVGATSVAMLFGCASAQADQKHEQKPELSIAYGARVTFLLRGLYGPETQVTDVPGHGLHLAADF
jgi:hypothetical protein